MQTLYNKDNTKMFIISTNNNNDDKQIARASPDQARGLEQQRNN